MSKKVFFIFIFAFFMFGATPGILIAQTTTDDPAEVQDLLSNVCPNVDLQEIVYNPQTNTATLDFSEDKFIGDPGESLRRAKLRGTQMELRLKEISNQPVDRQSPRFPLSQFKTGLITMTIPNFPTSQNTVDVDYQVTFSGPTLPQSVGCSTVDEDQAQVRLAQAQTQTPIQPQIDNFCKDSFEPVTSGVGGLICNCLPKANVAGSCSVSNRAIVDNCIPPYQATPLDPLLVRGDCTCTQGSPGTPPNCNPGFILVQDNRNQRCVVDSGTCFVLVQKQCKSKDDSDFDATKHIDCSGSRGIPCGSAGNPGFKTAIGCIHTSPVELTKDVLKFAIGIGGGLAFLMMLLGAFQMLTSAGNPETLATGKDRLTNAVIGLLFVIFSVLLLQIIGIGILDIPGFGR